MTTIKTTCEQCGDIELRPDDLNLELDPTNDSGSYLFRCPACGDLQRRPANPRVVNVLLATGVTYDVVVPEPGPITAEEIDRFVHALDREEDLWRMLPSS
ncbi:MAG: hypothetical protein GWP04_03580 [Gammaproteobacteria bacterium]|nr:hypothetical protein [Gammaproteobacteria bacterium]